MTSLGIPHISSVVHSRNIASKAAGRPSRNYGTLDPDQKIDDFSNLWIYGTNERTSQTPDMPKETTYPAGNSQIVR